MIKVEGGVGRGMLVLLLMMSLILSFPCSTHWDGIPSLMTIVRGWDFGLDWKMSLTFGQKGSDSQSSWTFSSG